MTIKQLRVSDLSGEVIEDMDERARLVVEGYPDFTDAPPITLDVLPDEIEQEIPQNTDSVLLSYYPPAEDVPRRFLMKRADFDKLAGHADMPSVLEDALHAQRELEEQRRPTRRRRQQALPAERIDYASPEHAGEPHRGRATEAEQEYVRVHLSEVNKRLDAAGFRQIHPTDPNMARRYGFEAQDAA